MQGEVPSQYLDTTIAVYRETGTADDVGDLSMTSTTIYDSIGANIQPDDSQIERSLQGVTHIQTHTCFINRYANSIKRAIKPGDIILDIEKGHKYLILSIEDWRTGEKQIDKGGCFKIGLKHIEDARYEIIQRQTLTVKASIT